MNKVVELTPDAREAISKYVWKLVIPTGIGLSIISFVLGFFVNETARSQAYAQSVSGFSSKMQDAAKDIGAATARAEVAATKSESLAVRIEDLNRQLHNLTQENQNTQLRIAQAQDQFSRTEMRMRELSASQQQTSLANADQLRELQYELRERIQQTEFMRSKLENLFLQLESQGIVEANPNESEAGPNRKDANLVDPSGGGDTGGNPFEGVNDK